MIKLILINLMALGSFAHARRAMELKFQPLARSHAPKFLLVEKKKMEADAKKTGTGDVEVNLAWVDLNHDRKRDFCVSFSGGPLGRTSNIQCFIAKSKTDFKKVADVIASPDFVSLPGTKTKGYSDLIFSGKGFDAHRVWKWTGKEYR